MPETRKPQWVRCGESGHEWIARAHDTVRRAKSTSFVCALLERDMGIDTTTPAGDLFE